jgi:hypothetical protein
MKTTLTAAVIGITLMSGCTTTPNIGEIATPERIESVVALGAYYGGKEIIKQGNRHELEQAHAALLELDASEVVDTLAIVRILEQTDLKGALESTEGQLVLAVAMVFIDGYSGSVTEIKDLPRVKAVVRGLARGFECALSPGMASVRIADPIAARLLDEAIATRPKH